MILIYIALYVIVGCVFSHFYMKHQIACLQQDTGLAGFVVLAWPGYLLFEVVYGLLMLFGKFLSLVGRLVVK